MQKQPSEGFFKKGFMRNFPELAEKHLWLFYRTASVATFEV